MVDSDRVLECFVRTTLLLAFLSLLFSRHSPAQAVPSYPDSADGFRQQLEDLITAKKSGDDSAWQSQLDALAIPSANDWLVAHFSPGDVARLQRDYPLFLAGFRNHASWVVDNAAHMPGWEMTAKPSECPPPPERSGPESEISVPTAPVSVENFRYGPAQPEDKIERSWVNSFVHIQGRFRYVGGTYPFWSEGLQQIRRPEVATLKGVAIHAARLIRKVNPDYPKKARKKHVEGVVRLHAIIAKDGTVREVTIVSGDPLLTDAAVKAVRQWRYVPTLLNAEPVEVDTTIDVTFALNK